MREGSPPAAAPAFTRQPPFVLFVETVALVGLVARIRPIFLAAGEMFRTFPTEDGYLMLTVARNLAMGLGMSTAGGTIPTNGVQPLMTLVEAGAFLVTGGDRAAGIRVLLGISTLISALAAWLVYRLGLRLMGNGPAAVKASLLGAAVWFSSPVVVFNSMNMLESGLYAAVVTATLLAFARGHSGTGGARSAGWCLGVGALLGLAFWARNDAVFLMAAVGIAHLAARRGGPPFPRRLVETSLMAGAALAVSLPWLLFGLLRFGSVVPVSGQAYLGGGGAGAALRWLAVALFEDATLVATFEFNPIQHWGPFVWLCGAAFLALAAWAAAAAARAREPRPAARPVLTAVILFGLGLAVFYTFFFDAPHFIRRYLFPLTPFLALLWGRAAVGIGGRLAAGRLKAAVPVLAVLLLANFISRDGLLITGPWRRGVFFRSVEWIQRSVPEETWLGAFQSGTLGFFHDRTINLDGKVNPEALEAIRRGRLPEYVVSSPIEYVIDWASLVEPWARSDAVVARHFVWDVRDPEGNFAVLRRRPLGREDSP